jgi:hypothetical protein
MLGIPKQIVAGDRISWTSPWSEGVLSWAIRGVGISLDLTATTENNEFVTVITSIQSSALPPGVYGWQAYLTVNGERQTIGTGRLEIVANFATLTSYDSTTQAEQMLAKVQACIESILTGGQAYQIGEREFTRADLAELRSMATRLKFQIYREDKALRGESPNLKIRFRQHG